MASNEPSIHDDDEAGGSEGDVGASESALGRHMGVVDVCGILFGRMIGCVLADCGHG